MLARALQCGCKGVLSVFVVCVCFYVRSHINSIQVFLGHYFTLARAFWVGA